METRAKLKNREEANATTNKPRSMRMILKKLSHEELRALGVISPDKGERKRKRINDENISNKDSEKSASPKKAILRGNKSKKRTVIYGF